MEQDKLCFVDFSEISENSDTYKVRTFIGKDSWKTTIKEFQYEVYVDALKILFSSLQNRIKYRDTEGQMNVT